ncbi:MAG: 3-deoxy-8-phosphooctulonate synthase, partial [Verrucomicrobiota bacterium]
MKIGSMEWEEAKWVFVLGPCVIASEALLRAVAAGLRGAADAGGHQIVFKASYDKANRSSVESYRG